VLQCVAVCYSGYAVEKNVLQCVAVCCSMLQRVLACCSVLQCVAAGSLLRRMRMKLSVCCSR